MNSFSKYNQNLLVNTTRFQRKIFSNTLLFLNIFQNDSHISMCSSSKNCFKELFEAILVSNFRLNNVSTFKNKLQDKVSMILW